MKIRIFIFMLAMLGMVNLSFGQTMKVSSVTDVTINSDTAYVQVTYDDNYNGVVSLSDASGYHFTVTNTVDTIELIVFEGTNGAVYVPIDSLTEPLDGSYNFNQYPSIFSKTRIGMYGASADTATLEDIIYYDRK
jgi:hypothetical protein